MFYFTYTRSKYVSLEINNTNNKKIYNMKYLNPFQKN